MTSTTVRTGEGLLSAGLQVVAALALLASGLIHLHLAPTYDPVGGGSVSQGDLFRVQAVASVVAALVLLVVRRWWSAAPAALVAGGSLAAVLVYRYVDVGAIGPIPSMYEPAWYDQKSWSAVADAVALAASLACLAIAYRSRRSDRS